MGGCWGVGVVKNIGKEGEVITIENYGEFMYQMMERGWIDGGEGWLIYCTLFLTVTIPDYSTFLKYFLGGKRGGGGSIFDT